MPLRDYPNLTGDSANLISMDFALGVRPENSSRLVYGPEELAFRRDLEEEFNGKNAVVDIRE